MSRYQYQTIVNGSKSPITDKPPVNWIEIAEVIENRGGIAQMLRRLITEHDQDFIDCLTSTAGFIFLPAKNMIICDWELFAEIEVR